MPKLSSPAPSVPPCLSPESARVWARLRNYLCNAERRTLLVIRHDSPRLPRELPLLLAEESGRPLVIAAVSDTEPDPMAAALRAAPGGEFPAGCILTITGAENLAVTAADNSKVALHEFARRLDLRRDQFLPAGGIVLVWATERVFEALAEHALNFISRAAAVLTLAVTRKDEDATPEPTPSPNLDSIHGHYRLPPLPEEAPQELLDALGAFEELAVANQLYMQGGSKIAHALASYDAARDRIEAGWATAFRLAALDTQENKNLGKPVEISARDFARALVAAYPDTGTYVLSLRQHPREQIVWLESQLRAARTIGDRHSEGAALGNLASVHLALGDVRKAIELYEQTLVIMREIEDQHGEGSTLGNLGNAYANLGDMLKAIEYYEQALVVSRDIGDRRGEGNALGNLGLAHAASGDAHKAIEFYNQEMVIRHEIGDRRGEAQSLSSLGNAYAALGDPRKAIECNEQAVIVSRAVGDRRGEGSDLGSLGVAHYALGDASKAIEYYEQQLKIARELGDRRGEGTALWNAALAKYSQGDHPNAIARAEEALKIFEAIEVPSTAKVRTALEKWRGEAK
jgi:tetratricopeptide (TPR) repeat protein